MYSAFIYLVCSKSIPNARKVFSTFDISLVEGTSHKKVCLQEHSIFWGKLSSLCYHLENERRKI